MKNLELKNRNEIRQEYYASPIPAKLEIRTVRHQPLHTVYIYYLVKLTIEVHYLYWSSGHQKLGNFKRLRLSKSV